MDNETDIIEIIVSVDFLIKSDQWRIQDFPDGGCANLDLDLLFRTPPQNCMKLKNKWIEGRASLAPLLDPPMQME